MQTWNLQEKMQYHRIARNKSRMRHVKEWNYSLSLCENAASVNSSSAGVFLPGLVELFKPFLSSLHVKYGTSIERLEKLVKRRLRKRFRKQALQRPMQRLQHRNNKTSEEDPLNLPSILEELHLNKLADWIAHKILQFQLHCTNTSLWQIKPVHTALIWVWYCLTCFIKSRSASDFVTVRYFNIWISLRLQWRMFDIQIVLMHFTVCPVNKCHMLCCTRLHCFVNITGVFFVLVLHWKIVLYLLTRL